jgi:sugar lactone lactonase YvrE
MARLTLAIGLITAGAIGAFVLAPSPIDPVAYTPPPAPALEGAYAPNNALQTGVALGSGQFQWPEDADVDSQGRVYSGSVTGLVQRVYPDGTMETFADTGGRPLGMDFDSQGHLIVCDSYKGLLSIDPEGKITVLATETDGIPYKFADDLDIAPDGMIYFSDASSKYGQTEYMLDMFEARPWGRLIRFDPTTGKTQTLMKDLYFANGVAVSKDGDFVLVNETYRYRVARYWLKGEKAGTQDIFMDNLPGFPDGISPSGRGTFWIALATPRNSDADTMHPHPALKKLVAKLPDALRPKPARYGFVVEVDESGKPIRSLQDPEGRVAFMVTSAQEHQGHLYLGSIANNAIVKVKL